MKNIQFFFFFFLSFIPSSYGDVTAAISTSEWTKCSASSNSELNKDINAECCTIELPFCYDDVCQIKDDKLTKVPIFVKRLIGKKTDNKKVTNALWVLDGGPGTIETHVEDTMIGVYRLLNEEIDVYKMDQRGVGKSFPLSCNNQFPDIFNLPNQNLIQCFDDASTNLNNLTIAFSTTSAAYDLKSLVELFNKEQKVYLYGFSYGSYLVDRYLQLSPKDQITGVIYDGAILEKGTLEQRFLVSRFTRGMDSVGRHLLHACRNNTFCSHKFDGKPIVFLQNLYKKQSTKDACPLIPSISSLKELKSVLSQLLQTQELLSFLPVFIYRYNRCNLSDAMYLGRLLITLYHLEMQAAIDWNLLLYSLIVSSELWEIPTASYKELEELVNSSIIASFTHLDLLRTYCISSQENSIACNEILNTSTITTKTKFSYKEDIKYFNKTANLTDSKTSVLFLAGRYDSASFPKQLKLQYQQFQASYKRVIWFNQSVHGIAKNTKVTSLNETCGRQIIASYIKENGNISNININCLNDIKQIEWIPSKEDSKKYMGTEDAYEGLIPTNN